MTSPLGRAVIRSNALSAQRAVYEAAKSKQQDENEIILRQQQLEVAQLVAQATARTRPSKKDKLALIVDDIVERVEQAVLEYSQDNSWPSEALIEAKSVCDYLFSVETIESEPIVPEYIRSVVWRLFCRSMIDMGMPLRHRYLNGMRQQKYILVKDELMATKQDRRPWAAPARRGSAEETLGELKTKVSSPDRTTSQMDSSQPETTAQRRARVRREAKDKPRRVRQFTTSE